MIFPPLLKKGDKIAIVAPAGKLPKDCLDEAIKVLKSWGLTVILGRHVYATDNYFAGSDEVRYKDIQLALDDPSINAVLCARGGYGITRIIDEIGLESIKQSPKWIIGFSDITALHLKLESQGIASIHGPMGTSFIEGVSKFAISTLKNLLFEGQNKIVANKGGVRLGSASATITGGNLSLIVDSLGTNEEIDTKDKILFIEEVSEKTYRVDRMFHQLLRAGKLEGLAGLAIGHFSEIDEGSTPFGESWQDSITSITRPYSYPLGFGFNIGHEPDNMALVMGGQYQLKVDADNSTLTWQTTD